MRTILPLALLFATLVFTTACGDGNSADTTPKSRTNERGEIERHLRHIASDGPAARPFPSPARPTTPVLPDTEPGQEPPTEAARARAISETHVHEHEHVDEPQVAQAQVAQAQVAQAQVAQAQVARAAEAHVAEAHVAEGQADDEPVVAPHVHEAAEEPTVVAAAPESSGESAPATGPSQVELTRVVAASAVTNREPVGAAPFASDIEQVFLFVEARNDGAPTTLAVRWIAPDGSLGRSIDLQIPTSRRWRTWATTRRTHDRPGQWTAVVSDDAGRELGRARFEISSTPSA